MAPKERVSDETHLARTALAAVCIVMVVFGFHSGKHLTDEHAEVQSFANEKYAKISSRHQEEGVADAMYHANGPNPYANGEQDLTAPHQKNKKSPDPNDGTVDWAKVPCKDMSISGRKFMVVSFVDEQMASANSAIDRIYKFCRNTNRTFVELMGGSRAINLKKTVVKSQYHASCPGSREQIKYQRYGALYDLNIMRKSGLSIADADEFWRLRECKLLPQKSNFLPFGDHPGGLLEGRDTCYQCNEKEGSEETATVFDFVTSERIGARNQMMCPFQEDALKWYDVALSDEPVVETCCIRKEWLGKLKPPPGIPNIVTPIDYVFSSPRFFATRFLESSGLSTNPAGYIGVQFRAEKMVKQWKHWDQYVNDTYAKIDKLITEHSVGGVKPKIFFACDFLGAGSLSFHKSGKAIDNLMKLPKAIGERHGGLVQLSPEKDVPEAIAADNNMLVAATELIIMARAKAFYAMVPSGRFQGMVNSEHKTHHLEGGDRKIPVPKE